VLYKNIYKMLFLILLCSLNSIGSNAVSTLGECFKELHRRLAIQATSETAALSIDSTDKVFNTLLKNNSPIVKLLRANSNGIIINESSQQSSNHVMRNISGQQWFIQVQRDTQPYYGITRDSIGYAFLFWVWPLKNVAGQFAGVLAAKIDPSEIIDFVNDLKPISLRLDINDKTVLTRGWKNPQNIESASWKISEALIITCYYQSNISEVASQTKQIASNFSVSASVPQQNQPDSTEISSEEKVGKKPVLRSFLLIFLISSLAVMFYFKIGRKWMPSNHRSVGSASNPELSSSNHENIEEIMDLVDDSSLSNGKSDLHLPVQRYSQVQEESSKESIELQENKAISEKTEKSGTAVSQVLYNQKKEETSNRAMPHFRPGQSIDHQSDSEISRIRNELYREIHGQIIHWVVCESARLSNCLEELTGRINRLEGSEGSAELELIREDAMRISKEIEIFKESFSDSKE